ncbi:MAG: hypothetical protein FWC16_00690 [Defluviitaleaceae bacterium]|nr:hypothetical protein [Defluviitaleaceae bacterium]MCL2273421.1 hypothetical protein [Defluviitaleaceae bacterium]
MDDEYITIEIPEWKRIKKCPFCGTNAAFKGVKTYFKPGVKIECPKCHVGTSRIITGRYMFYKGKKDVTFTMEQAINEAADIWNNRVLEDEEEYETISIKVRDSNG